MNPLKNAIGKDKPTSKKAAPHSDDSLLRGVNRSKNANLLALDDDDEEGSSPPTDQDISLFSIRKKLSSLHQLHGLSLNESILKVALKECQEELSWSKGEMTSLLVLSDKVGCILETNPQGQFKTFLLKFLSLALATIETMKNREKKEDLNHFNELATLTFTKKNHYKHSYNENNINKLKEKPTQSSVSTDKHRSQEKLGRLFSKDKKPIKDAVKDGSGQGNANLRSSYKEVTFSAAINSSIGVRMRRSKPIEKPPPQQLVAQSQDKTEQEQNAFMFFRPKTQKRAK